MNQSLLRKTTTAKLESQAMSEGRTLAKRGYKLGLNIDKAAAALYRFKPRTVAESLEHWYENQRGKPLFVKNRDDIAIKSLRTFKYFSFTYSCTFS